MKRCVRSALDHSTRLGWYLCNVFSMNVALDISLVLEIFRAFWRAGLATHPSLRSLQGGAACGRDSECLPRMGRGAKAPKHAGAITCFKKGCLLALTDSNWINMHNDITDPQQPLQCFSNLSKWLSPGCCNVACSTGPFGLRLLWPLRIP